jgi:hypothetical protein
MKKIKLDAARRLTAKRRILAAGELVKEGGMSISTGGNSFKFPTPEEAYEKAAQFIKQIQHDGYKYTRRGTMSDKMDVFKKGSSELSVSVRDGILNVDLW